MYSRKENWKSQTWLFDTRSALVLVSMESTEIISNNESRTDDNDKIDRCTSTAGFGSHQTVDLLTMER